jgi:MtN3 and saliva related transmembrane protein
MLSTETINFIGLCAGALTTGSFLPQLVETYRNKSAKGLSYAYLLTFSFGVILWLIYGVLLKAPPVIITNGVTLALVVGIVGLKARYGRLAFNAEPQRKVKAKS